MKLIRWILAVLDGRRCGEAALCWRYDHHYGQHITDNGDSFPRHFGDKQP